MTIENITIERTGKKDFEFKGKLVASASSSFETASPDYSGKTGRSESYKLYVTEGGAKICQKINLTCWHGESNNYEAIKAENDSEIIDFFGQNWIAKELYDIAEIKNVEIIK